jgi:hypothetical protein
VGLIWAKAIFTLPVYQPYLPLGAKASMGELNTKWIPGEGRLRVVLGVRAQQDQSPQGRLKITQDGILGCAYL